MYGLEGVKFIDFDDPLACSTVITRVSDMSH